MSMQAIDASKLDNEITLQHRVQTRNTQGEQVASWVTYARVWADKHDLRGNESFTAQQVYGEVMTEFVMRWRPDVMVTDRLTVLDGGAVYEIKTALEIPRHVGLDLMCRTIIA
jgi:SPP1 family predicted phage head-tail adaptor